jgi:hypothetical protein
MAQDRSKLTVTENVGCCFGNQASNLFCQAFGEAWKVGACWGLWDQHGKPKVG